MTYDELTPAERERLRIAYDAGFAAGSAQPWRLATDDPDTIALIDAITQDWFTALEIAPARPAWPIDAPAWLRAHAERQILEVRE